MAKASCNTRFLCLHLGKAIFPMNQRVILQSYYNSGREQKFDKQIKGIFQKWGETILDRDGKYFQVTIAIVLSDDGNVYIGPPESMSLASN